MNPTVFHYDPITYCFLGTSNADESPLEPGIYLYPAYSTSISTPAQYPPEGFNFIWDISSSTWNVVPIPPIIDSETTEPIVYPDGLTQLRNVRNIRLYEIDWVAIKYFTQGIPYPIEWAEYVQLLRDLPSLYPEPPLLPTGELDVNAIIWPSKPSMNNETSVSSTTQLNTIIE